MRALFHGSSKITWECPGRLHHRLEICSIFAILQIFQQVSLRICELHVPTADMAADSVISDTLTSAATTTLASALNVSPPTTAGTEIKALAESPGFIRLVFNIVYATVYHFQRFAFALIFFATYTLPAWLFAVFSMSLTFTMNFTTLYAPYTFRAITLYAYANPRRMIIFLIFGSVISWAFRYRLLYNFNRLPPEPQRKEPEIDLFPDSQEGDSKAGFSSYLDEFLSAIKVFGYLERPVFHELTRSMQTRKLIAGETLMLEEEKGFCIVVDGLVQVFVKSAREAHGGGAPYGAGGAFDDEEENQQGTQGYQLLTEVKNGAPMSSLFTILSLFTEDVRLRHEEEEDNELHPSESEMNLPEMDEELRSPLDGGEPMSRRDSFSTSRMSNQGTHLPSVPPYSLDGGTQRPPFRRMQTNSVHPDILARATVDTTIAVIPASAFRRLTRIYPKATAHIVQVILARFQRVTFLTGYDYLGLTSEVLRTEKFMNRYTMYELPNHLRGGALDRLKEKFQRERERAETEDPDLGKGIVLHNPASSNKRRRRSSAALRKEAAVHARVASAKGSPSPALDTAPSPFQRSPLEKQRRTYLPLPMRSPYAQGWDAVSPGTPMTHRAFDPFARSAAQFMGDQSSQNEDTAFREAVLECMFKAIGLTGFTNGRAAGGTDSGDASPRLLSYDSRRQKAVFSNAFGQLSMLGGGAGSDGDTESVGSASGMSAASTSGFAGGGISGVHAELKDEVEIVFFPKGSVLVEQGERDPGLYYLIDGFLDVSIPVDEKTLNQNQMFGSSHQGMDDVEPDLPPLTKTPTNNSSYSSGSPPKKEKKLGRKSLFLIKPGGLAGYIGSITSYRSFIDVTAKTDVYVGFLPRSALERITEKHPVVLMTMAKRLTSLLPRLILHIDFALEWLQVQAGQVIHHQGDER